MTSESYQEYPVEAPASEPGAGLSPGFDLPSSPADLFSDAMALLGALRASDTAEAAFCANRVRGAAIEHRSEATRQAAEALEYALIGCGLCDAGPVFRAFQSLLSAMEGDGLVSVATA